MFNSTEPIHFREAGTVRLLKNYPTFCGTSKVHCHVHNSPPPAPLLSNIIPVHTTASYLSKFHLNIIDSSMSRSS